MTRRDAAQTLYISLLMQAELIETLLIEGALSSERARPLVGRVALLAMAWRNEFEEGPDMLTEILDRLRMRTGAPSGEFPPRTP